MATVSDIVTGGLRLIGIRDLTDEDRITEAIDALNSMLTAMRKDFHHSPVEEIFPLVVGTNEYTIGTGGTFNTSRPIDIISAFIRDTSGNDHEVRTDLSKKDYDLIYDKDATARPNALYYAKENPLGIIYLNSDPSEVENLYISSIKPYAEYTAMTDTFLLPLEYEDPIKYYLAVRLAPEYLIEPSTYVVQQYAMYKDMIEAENSRPVTKATLPIELRRCN